MKKFLLGMMCVLLIGCSAKDEPANVGNIDWFKDFDAAKQMASSQNKPILIDFYTDWCGWCKRLDKDTYANGEVEEALKQFVCVKINAEKQKDLTQKFKVRGFPSTVFLEPNGEFIEVVPGYMPPENFLEMLDRILQKIEA